MARPPDTPQALAALYHSPGVDPAPLKALADEVADWTSAYFPVSFNPPPGAAAALPGGRPPITRADLVSGLEAAMASSPFLAGGVLPLLVEKLSSTYRCVAPYDMCTARNGRGGGGG